MSKQKSGLHLPVIILITIGAFVLLWATRHMLSQRLADRTSDDRLAVLLARAGVTHLDFGPTPDAALVKLGEALFFDKILSGNRDISCATCHHPLFAGGDGLPLSFGTGGRGLGPSRTPGDHRVFVPRNAPEIFNRGSPEWTTMFWDGRISLSKARGLITPAGNTLPGLLATPLEAQAMFPVTSRDEMRGASGDRDIHHQPNELATIADPERMAMWTALMERVLAVPAYIELFRQAYPDVPVESLGFEHAAKAIAAYEVAAFTFNGSPWDRYLAGDKTALPAKTKRGAILFYGEAGCAACHSGNLLTDQQFHNIGVPQLGPGKLSEDALDLGRYLETGHPKDRYAFRTPPLRNVTLTGPYMHNGCYADLEAAVRHHLGAAQALAGYDAATLPDPFRATVRADASLYQDILQSLDLRVAAPPVLSDAQVSDLMAFLETLTDPEAADLGHLVPATVPSGLPVQD